MARGYESDRARRRPEVRILKRASFAEQDAALDQIIHTYKVSRLWMDQTGMGENRWRTPAATMVAPASTAS